MKDLGVTVDSALNWSTHIRNIIANANKMLYLVKRTVGYNAPITVKKQLFLSVVRSNLEYCSPIWSGTSKNNVTKLESVQRSATKYILGYNNCQNKNYKERLGQLNLTPLSYRREIQDCVFFYKCLNKINNLNISEKVQFTHNNSRATRSTVDMLQLCIPMCNTETCKKLYFKRIVCIWNCLPVNVRNSSSLSIFKACINDIYKSSLILHYDSNNVCTWNIICTCINCRNC